MNEQYTTWTNTQTWNINLMYGETFEYMVEEHEYEDRDHVIDTFNNLVAELEFQGLREGSLAWQAVGEYLDRVDWEQLADHYFAKGSRKKPRQKPRKKSKQNRLNTFLATNNPMVLGETVIGM